jgi:hypothetical protein
MDIPHSMLSCHSDCSNHHLIRRRVEQRHRAPHLKKTILHCILDTVIRLFTITINGVRFFLQPFLLTSAGDADVFFGPDLDPSVRGTDPDPYLSIIKQK